jgi:hypothetical protein
MVMPPVPIRWTMTVIRLSTAMTVIVTRRHVLIVTVTAMAQTVHQPVRMVQQLTVTTTIRPSIPAQQTQTVTVWTTTVTAQPTMDM